MGAKYTNLGPIKIPTDFTIQKEYLILRLWWNHFNFFKSSQNGLWAPKRATIMAVESWLGCNNIDISKKNFSIQYIDISIFFSIFPITFLKYINDKFLWYIILMSYNYSETLLPCFTKQGLRSIVSEKYQIKYRKKKDNTTNY